METGAVLALDEAEQGSASLCGRDLMENTFACKLVVLEEARPGGSRNVEHRSSTPKYQKGWSITETIIQVKGLG